MKFFSIEGPLYQFFSRLLDMIKLNFLWLLFSLPIITIGASTAAAFSVTLKMVDEREGYIAKQSSHSRGSAIDLTLLDMKTGKELDMGSPFDLFSEVSHPDYRGVTKEQYENRMLLQRAMVRNGFVPLACEWWHFALKDEPYPDTYFTFPVSSAYLRR